MRDVPNSFIIEGVDNRIKSEVVIMKLLNKHPFISIKETRYPNSSNFIIRYQNVRGFRGWLMGLWYRSRWIKLYNRNIMLFHEGEYYGTVLLYKLFKLS